MLPSNELLNIESDGELAPRGHVNFLLQRMADNDEMMMIVVVIKNICKKTCRVLIQEMAACGVGFVYIAIRCLLCLLLLLLRGIELLRQLPTYE